jgi:hypothetical protein
MRAGRIVHDPVLEVLRVAVIVQCRNVPVDDIQGLGADGVEADSGRLHVLAHVADRPGRVELRPDAAVFVARRDGFDRLVARRVVGGGDVPQATAQEVRAADVVIDPRAVDRALPRDDNRREDDVEAQVALGSLKAWTDRAPLSK